MYIDEKDSGDIDLDDADEGMVEKMQGDDDDPEQDRIIKEVAPLQRMIQSIVGKQYNFYVCARHIQVQPVRQLPRM